MVRRKQEEVHNSQNVNYKNIYNVFPQIFCGIFIFKKLMEIRNSYDIIYKQKNVKGVINMQEQEFLLSQENKFKKVEHTHPMLSLANSYNIGEIVDFIERIKKKIPKEQELKYGQ